MSQHICERCGDAYNYYSYGEPGYCESCSNIIRNNISEAKRIAEKEWSWVECSNCDGRGYIGPNRLTCEVCDGKRRLKEVPDYSSFLPSDHRESYTLIRRREKEEKRRQREEEEEERRKEREEEALERKREIEEAAAERRREEMTNFIDKMNQRRDLLLGGSKSLFNPLYNFDSSNSSDDSDSSDSSDDEEKKDCCYIISATLRELNLPVESSEEIGLMRKLKIDFLGKSFSGLREIVRYNRLAPVIVDSINKRQDRHEIYSGVYNNDLRDVTSLLRGGEYEAGYTRYKQMVLSLASKVL